MFLLARKDCDVYCREEKLENRTEQLYNRTTHPPAQVAALHLPQRVAVNTIMWYAAESAAASYLMLINSS